MHFSCHFLNHVFLVSSIVRIQYLLHRTYKMHVNQLFVTGKANSRLWGIEWSYKLSTVKLLKSSRLRHE